MPIEQEAVVAASAAGRDAAGCALVAEALARFGSVRLRVRGTSMLPAIWPGDILSIERVAPPELRVDDIVLYRRGGRLFAHRVVDPQLSRGRLLTRGDRLPSPDSPLSAKDALGRIARIDRGPFRLPAGGPAMPWRLVSAMIDAWRASRRWLSRTRSLGGAGLDGAWPA